MENGDDRHPRRLPADLRRGEPSARTGRRLGPPELPLLRPVLAAGQSHEGHPARPAPDLLQSVPRHPLLPVGQSPLAAMDCVSDRRRAGNGLSDPVPDRSTVHHPAPAGVEPGRTGRVHLGGARRTGHHPGRHPDRTVVVGSHPARHPVGRFRPEARPGSEASGALGLLRRRSGRCRHRPEALGPLDRGG